MLKKIILTVLSLSFYACGNLPNGKTTDPSINLADRHIWIPADEEDLEKRRLLQTHFDGIADNIETLFLNLESISPREANMNKETKDFISEIGSLESSKADQITNEKKRVDNLSKELEGVRISSTRIKRQVVNLNLAPVFTREEYINAFYYFRKGQYIKSAKLFKNFLRLKPPHLLVDNILFGLSMSYFKMKKFSIATEPLHRIIEKYPKSDKWYMSHIMLALLHERKGEKSQALYILEKGLKNNPPYFIRSMINNLIDLVHDETNQTSS